MVSGVPLVPFSECKITDFFRSHQMFSQLFFKKKIARKGQGAKRQRFAPWKNFRLFSVDNTAKVGNAKNMTKTCGGIFRVLCRRTWFRKENMGRGAGFRAIIYISRWQKLFLEYAPGALFWPLTYGQRFSQHDCGTHFSSKVSYNAAPRPTPRSLFIRRYAVWDQELYFVVCSRPPFVLLAAEGSITRGRE